MSTNVTAFGATDVGRTRPANEDAFIARRPLFLVADGMGGHARGAAASAAAIRVFDERISATARPSPADVLDVLAAANDAVRALSTETDTGPAVSGTTLVGVVEVVVDGSESWLALNIGDSRLYGWNGRELEQLSVDHSAVQELYDAGLISAEEMAVHPERNIITRALGSDDVVDADVWLLPRTENAVFVICSDGLTLELSDHEIARILAGSVNATGAGDPAAALVRAAVDAGGRDNVTAIVVEARG